MTRARKDVDIPQFAWWQQSSSIQKFELWCDTCSLPDDYSLRRDNFTLAGLGVAAGLVLGALTPLLLFAWRHLAAPLSTATNLCFPHRKRRL